MIANIFGRAPHPYKMSMVIVIEPDERPEPPLEPIGQDLNRSRLRAPKTDSDFERLLTPKETAQFLRLSESWLAKARMRGRRTAVCCSAAPFAMAGAGWSGG